VNENIISSSVLSGKKRRNNASRMSNSGKTDLSLTSEDYLQGSYNDLFMQAAR